MKPEMQLSKPIWKGKPSYFHFTSQYIISILAIWLLFRLQYYLSSDPYTLITQYAYWTRPLNMWSIHDWPLWAIAASYIAQIIFGLKLIFCILRAALTVFILSDDQIIVRQFTPFGIMEHRTEMYRLVDFTQRQSFIDVFFSLSSVILKTTDQNTPAVCLFGIRRGDHVINILRHETEKCRLKKGVREFTSAAMTPTD